jgi:nitrite reductase (NADH) large subunit
MPEKTSSWRCTVCGYVHRGSEAPETCPVCGAPAELFEPQVEPAPTGSAAKPAPVATKWRCAVCGYVHEGLDAPAECPVCGATADCFEPVESPAPKVTGVAQEPLKAVIIGAGIAGVSAAESLRAASPGAEITILSNESELPYYRLNLTRFLAGEIGENDLLLHPAEWYEKQHIQLRLNVAATALKLDEQFVELDNGERLPFDKLLLAAGAHPLLPPISGIEKNGVTGLRTTDDARKILSWSKPGASCVVIGGGLLGLETAGGLARRGVQVSILEGFEWLLPRQLNRRAGEILAQYAASLGIRVQVKAKVAEIAGDDRVREVRLEDGVRFDADFVVVAAGIRPNMFLARQAGIEVHQGVVVDSLLATSHEDIHAVGDIAEHLGVVYGLWGPSQFQGSIAGMNMAGDRVEFGGIPRSNTLKVLGMDLFSIGEVQPPDASYQVFDREDAGNFFRLVFRDNHLVGAVLLGDTRQAATAKNAIETGRDFSEILHEPTTAASVIGAI